MALEKFKSVRGASEASTVVADQVTATTKGGSASVLIRLTSDQRKRLKTFAVEEGSSIQALGFRALSRLLEEKGLPPL